ncbi:MAG: tyrosine-type recombinase/integrase [Candidatus Bathyarchaeia archaeon]
MICCPQCGSPKLWRDGLRRLANGFEAQRWLCRNCGYRFTDPNFKRQNQWKIPPFSLNPEDGLDHSCRGNNEPYGRDSTARPRAVQTLATVEKQGEKRAAGATAKQESSEIHAKLLEFLWWMKKQGYKETTINSKDKRLSRLIKLGANLFDPESVKEVLATQNWKESSKETTAYAYDLFARWLGIKWDKPRYRPPRKLPFIPQEREIDDLIAGCNSVYASTFLQILKETGARAGEAFNLKWIDIDLERKTITITPEKGSNPRLFRISNKLATMLSSLPRNGERVFSKYRNLRSLSSNFERNRKRIAFKLGNPRLLKISFHTLRHWKATMEYHKTKDILHVMEMLGHRNIKNTLVYTQLINSEGEDEYICKVAKSVEQAAELIEAGFEYVCEIDGIKLFRKRK